MDDAARYVGSHAASLDVVSLPEGKVSLRVRVGREREYLMTMDGEQACDLAMQLMAAATGRLASDPPQ